MRFHALYGGSPSPLQVIAYVVSGIGFLGAGAIMKEGQRLGPEHRRHALGSAAVGCCAGAVAASRPCWQRCSCWRRIRCCARWSIASTASRCRRASARPPYTVYVICQRAQSEVRERLVEWLEAASYPVRDIDQHPFGQGDAGDRGHAHATAVDGDELDQIMARLEAEDGVLQAFWNASAED